MRVRKKNPRQPSRLVGEGGERVEPRHQAAARDKIGVDKLGAHQF